MGKKICKDFFYGAIISYCLILAYYLFTIPEDSTLPMNLLKTLFVPIFLFFLSIMGFFSALFTINVYLLLYFFILFFICYSDIKKEYRFFRYRVVVYLLLFFWLGVKAFYQILGGA